MANGQEPPDTYVRQAVVRRRSPGHVRQMDRDALHSLTRRLLREQFDRGISRGQDWLLNALISELEYRHRRESRGTEVRACLCDLCRPVDERLYGAEEQYDDGYGGRSRAIDLGDASGCR